MRLPPSRTALLLVDLQNYDAHPEYGLGPILREVRPEAAAYFIEYEILQAVHPSPADVVVHKNTVSAFNSSNLDGVLRNMGIECLVVGGVVTDSCVDSTARDASDRGYDCVIVEDACAAWSPAWHASARQAFERYFGLVSTTDDIARAVTTSREVSGGLADDRLAGVSDRPGRRAAPSASGGA